MNSCEEFFIHSDIISYVFLALIVVLCLFAPVVLTIMNTAALFTPREKLKEKKRLLRSVRCAVTVLLGAFDSWLFLYGVMGVSLHEYSDQLSAPDYESIFHTPISFDYGGIWFVVLFMLSTLCLCLLHMTAGKRKPPLVGALLIGGTAVCAVLSVLFGIQIGHPVVWVYPANLVMLSIRGILDEVTFQTETMKQRDAVPESGFAASIYRMLAHKSGWIAAGLAAMLPFAALALIILILRGEGPDGLVKTFTMTADWTFSKQIPPPTEYYDGHYLCTVAAGGHRRLVKPTRMGIRRGERIVVNRQLCVANAFEDLIKEKTPRFHKAVRSFYDKHGYPISQHITTPLRADIVYILMKPLEWFFVIVLYLFDLEPENRIAVQYTTKP